MFFAWVTHPRQLLATPKGFSPVDYEKKLGNLGKVLQAYDHFDESIDTFYALFDGLIAATGQPAVRSSSLTLTAALAGQNPMTKILTA